MIEDEDSAKILLKTGNYFKNLESMIEGGDGTQKPCFLLFQKNMLIMST